MTTLSLPPGSPVLDVHAPGQDRSLRLALAFLGTYTGHTQKAYRRDLEDYAAWLAPLAVDPLDATRQHVEAYVRDLTDRGLAPSTVARRLTTLAGLYRYAVAEGVLAASPVAHVRRPKGTGDSPTLGLDRDETRALLAAVREHGTDRDAVLFWLLLLNGLRVSEALAVDVADLGKERGHRTLTVIRKGGKRRVIALAPATAAAVDTLAAGRTSGPLLCTRTGRPLDSAAAFGTVRRFARLAGIRHADRISPHSLRHAAITLALDAGVSLRDVQDFAGHADPRTTRRYDRSRDSLDRHATYALAAYLDAS